MFVQSILVYKVPYLTEVHFMPILQMKKIRIIIGNIYRVLLT